MQSHSYGSYQCLQSSHSKQYASRCKLSGPPDRDIVWAPPVRVVIVCGGGAYDDDACDACRRGCDPSVAVELLLRGCDPSVAVELHSDCTTAGAIRQL